MTDTAKPPLLIDVGVFAHNEAATIRTAIEAIGGQDIMNCAEIDLRVIVLANGCTDNTVAHAREAAAKLPPAIAARFEIASTAIRRCSMSIPRSAACANWCATRPAW